MEDEKESVEPDEDDEISTFAATGVQIGLTSWVIQMIFSETTVGKNVPVEVPRLAITLPWALAKVFHEVLGVTLQRYEAQEGEIVIPRTVREVLKKQIEVMKPSV